MLQGLNFELPEGRCLQVSGANGSGKTSLLRAICGLIEIESGTFSWRGVDIWSARAEFNAQMTYLGHVPALKEDLSTRENLSFAVGLRRVLSASQLEVGLQRVAAENFADQPVRALSVGQRRRIAFAGLWLSQVPLWLLDEPSSNLDTQGQDLLTDLMSEHLNSGGTIIAASHQPLELDQTRLYKLNLTGFL